MKDITLNRTQKTAMATRIQEYLNEEHGVELGQFDSEFFVDFIVNEFGPALYNQGLKDAEQVFSKKIIDIEDELYQISKEDKYT